MKWGTAFNSDYVNILSYAAKKHIDDLDAFICITDDSSGLNPSVEAQAFPDIPLDESFYKAGAWPKLSLFKKGVLPDGYRTLFIDLDMIICGDLNRFFDLPQDFYAIGPTSWDAPEKKPKSALYTTWKAWRSAKKQAKRNNILTQLGLDAKNIQPNTLGSGIFAFNSGTLPHVYDDFFRDPETNRILYDNEQHFLESRLIQWAPWPPEWVSHYKYNLRQPLLKDLLNHPRPPSKNTSVVAFSGRPRPHELAENYLSSIKEFPHCRVGKVPWVENYWRAK
jgi:hypothetical protein